MVIFFTIFGFNPFSTPDNSTWLLVLAVAVKVSFAMVTPSVRQGSQAHLSVSQAVSLLMLSGSLGQMASTMNLIVFMLSMQLMVPVNACEVFAGMVKGVPGVVGDKVVTGPVPFTRYLMAVTCAGLVRWRLLILI